MRSTVMRPPTFRIPAVALSLVVLATMRMSFGPDEAAAADTPVVALKPQAGAPPSKPAVESSDPRFFDAEVKPIFVAKCVKCHGATGPKADLNLTSQQGILKGGESGVAIEPGNPDKSRLYERVHEREMPPDGKEPLTEPQLAAIRAWISNGAKFEAASTPGAAVTQADVLPILFLRCTTCHGLRRHEGGLDLRSKASMLKGGKSGPAIVPGKPSESLILKRIAAGEMPPAREIVTVSVKPIEPQEVELLSRWIQQGAREVDVRPDVATREPDPLVTDKDRQFWSFQPPKATPVPAVKDISTVRNPIDAFILQPLEAKGLSLSPEADRLTLIRRATYDLTGLPPAPEDVERFLADGDPQAYERLIDRLLASPRYGERWVRVWLDLAGYADSEGIQHADVPRPNAYRYRDYVIKSLNADKPYDRFLTEQIAGDELADYEHAPLITEELSDNLVATAFLTMAPDGTYSPITGFVPDRLKVIDDEMEVLASSTMGLTFKCARCHSHKFDPIPQRDYYRLTAIFKGALDEHDWLKPQQGGPKPGENDRLLPFVPSDELAAWESRTKQLEAHIKSQKSALEAKTAEATSRQFEKRLVELPRELHDDVRKLLATPADKRNAVQKYLAEKFEARLRISTDELKKLDADFAKAAESAEAENQRLEDRREPRPLIRALWDRGEPSPSHVLRRGDYLQPALLVGPGVPSVLTDGRTPFVIDPPWPGAAKTGRRLAFARWLTRPEHPLTARVLVNRMWKQHFGTGIVRSLDNFGHAGAKPSHPELLDWLAVDFARSGWSLKQLHRRMMTSQTYRQSSQITADHLQRDPENELLSRMSLRRLEAEMLRDSLLAVSGRLDGRPYGPCEPVSARPDGLVTSNGGEGGWRRSIYVLQRRTEVPTILSDFDLPAMSPNCVQRTESIVAPQALHLMNNATVHDLANDFAHRVAAEVGDDVNLQIDRVYRLAYSRPPSEEEWTAARQAIDGLVKKWQAELAAAKKTPSAVDDNTAAKSQQRALANFCHAVVNSARFLYVD